MNEHAADADVMTADPGAARAMPSAEQIAQANVAKKRAMLEAEEQERRKREAEYQAAQKKAGTRPERWNPERDLLDEDIFKALESHNTTRADALQYQQIRLLREIKQTLEFGGAPSSSKRK